MCWHPFLSFFFLLAHGLLLLPSGSYSVPGLELSFGCQRQAEEPCALDFVTHNACDAGYRALMVKCDESPQVERDWARWTQVSGNKLFPQALGVTSSPLWSVSSSLGWLP
jgi:hypothetical protein